MFILFTRRFVSLYARINQSLKASCIFVGVVVVSSRTRTPSRLITKPISSSTHSSDHPYIAVASQRHRSRLQLTSSSGPGSISASRETNSREDDARGVFFCCAALMREHRVCRYKFASLWVFRNYIYHHFPDVGHQPRIRQVLARAVAKRDSVLTLYTVCTKVRIQYGTTHKPPAQARFMWKL